MPAHPCLKKGAAAARRATHADDLEGRLAVNRLHKVLPVKAWASRLRTARVTYHITAALSTVIVAAVPATGPRGLRADLLHQVRDCGQEPVADYLTRIARIVLALRAHGVAISSGELDMLTTKASLLAEEFGQVGGDWHPTRMVRRVRTRFSVAAVKGKGQQPAKSGGSTKEAVPAALPGAGSLARGDSASLCGRSG